ncbi:MAG: hypothetical protein Q9218_005103 [Villophora microphyllina]
MRDSDETKGEMDIETYLHLTDPCRSITMRSPWPLPISHVAPRQSVVERLQNTFNLRPDILAILRRHGLQQKWLQVRACTKLRYHDGMNTRLIMRVFLAAENGQSTSIWSVARKEIHSLLSTKGFEDIDVELVSAGTVTTMTTVHESIRTKTRLRRNVLGVGPDGLDIEHMTVGGAEGVLELGN